MKIPTKKIRSMMVAFVAFITFGSQLSNASNPFFGVCVHPWGVYSGIPSATLLDLVQGTGSGLFRVDLGTSRYALTDQLLEGAQTRDINILAILYGTNGDYTSSYDEGFAFATKYAGKISYYQVSNEQDVATGKSTIIDGQLPTEFDDIKYAKAKNEIQGLLDGIKAGDPNAKTMVNFTWLHYGFIQRLVNDGIDFDILAIDWYSEMGDITNVKGINLIAYSKKQFGKPLWITEGNRRDGSMGGNETAQAAYISQTAKSMYHNPDISAYIVYELLDEPNTEGGEAFYGLAYNVNSTKPAYNAYKDAIASCTGRTFYIQTP
jgi:hypothetical protein